MKDSLITYEYEEDAFNRGKGAVIIVIIQQTTHDDDTMMFCYNSHGELWLINLFTTYMVGSARTNNMSN